MKIVVSFIIILFGTVISLRTSFQKVKLKLLRPITIAMKATGKDTNSAAVNTGYNYAQMGLDYDVPFINTFKWYRMLVRKNSENTICNMFKSNRDSTHDNTFKGVVEDAFYPTSVGYKFQGRKNSGAGLLITYKPLIPGLLFIKTKMSASIADDYEEINGIRGFVRNKNGLVVPLNDVEVSELEVMKTMKPAELDEEMKRLHIGCYVSVVDGRHKGKYGIIEGTSYGQILVRLRSEYQDSEDTIAAEHLRYLANPPEIHYQNRTAKEAVEALMVKTPNGEMLRYLKKEGLLRKILHPELYNTNSGSSSGSSSSTGTNGGGSSSEERRGREGGRTMRSIAVN